MRKKFLKWLIKGLLPGFHLQKNGTGRKKKELFIEVDMDDDEKNRNIVKSAKEFYAKGGEREQSTLE